MAPYTFSKRVARPVESAPQIPDLRFQRISDPASLLREYLQE